MIRSDIRLRKNLDSPFPFRSYHPHLDRMLQMPDLSFLRNEIEYMRRQLQRQRKGIRDLQRAGIPKKPAEELLERMQAKIDSLCNERDRQRKEQSVKYAGTDKPIRGAIERRIR
jgi:hypothetical protein